MFSFYEGFDRFFFSLFLLQTSEDERLKNNIWCLLFLEAVLSDTAACYEAAIKQNLKSGIYSGISFFL